MASKDSSRVGNPKSEVKAEVKKCLPPLLTVALAYAERGWPVFPTKRDKSPITRHGFKDATTDPKQIRAWWKKHPEAGVAIPTGSASGLVVIDIDPRNGGDRTIKTLGHEIPGTVTVSTGGGGQHLYFVSDKPIRSGSGKLGPGVDVKAEGGYVVAPPSLHESGQRYQWLVEHSPEDLEVATLPPWIYDAVKANGKPTQAPAGGAGTLIDDNRNVALTSLAGTMRRRGMSERAILAALKVESAERCVLPLEDEEVAKIARSVSRYAPSDPVVPADKGEEDRPLEEPHYTDTGNAERFVRDHGGGVIFCHPWRRWLVWDGVRWGRDERGEIDRRAKQTVLGMYENAARLIFNDDERSKLGKHAVRSESERARKAMLELAKSELPVVPDELDADPWLLNVHNGTIRLRDGKLYRHSRDDRITKCAGTLLDPTADCPGWLAFLDRIFEKSPETIAFVQRALGYSLTGDTSEESFFVCYGTGANGKSTLFGVVQEVLGDYATTTRAETVLAKRNPDSIPNDVAALVGARFVTAIEAEEGRRLAAGLVKSLTGRDRISARFMRGEFFEFDPVFKLWLGVNHKPRITDSSEAMWRRVKLIPFTVTIPKEERDKELRERLVGREGPGILAWLVRGCLEWQRNGLGSCEAVDRATREYQAESNTVSEWVALACEIKPGASVRVRELHDAFVAWCEGEKETPIGSRAFGDRIVETFPMVKRGKVREQRAFLGIGLKPPDRTDRTDRTEF